MNKKQAICDALRAFICQRPGFEPGNYGSMAVYRSESRRVTRDRGDALTLLRQVELSDSITADAMLKEAGSGRLTIMPHLRNKDGGKGRKLGEEWYTIEWYTIEWYTIEWCTGQYWPVEFRAGAARCLASVL